MTFYSLFSSEYSAKSICNGSAQCGIYNGNNAKLFKALYATAFYMGDLSFYRTYNTCIEEAEQIRVALSDFKKNGKYPAVLDDSNILLPC
jgi:hypothetical protein